MYILFLNFGVLVLKFVLDIGEVNNFFVVCVVFCWLNILFLGLVVGVVLNVEI